MSDENIKDLLARLLQELDNTDSVDSETVRLVRELNEDIHRLVDPESESNDLDSVIDRAKAMQAEFALEHPKAEQFLREIMAALSRVGI